MATNNVDSDSIDLSIGDFFFGMAADLKLTVLFTLVTLAFIYVPVLNETIIRPVLGLAMVLFVPGYALIAALFPGRKDLDGIERAALSFGLSIAVTPLIGLGLNYTPWGIRLDPIVVCLTVFTLVCVLVANRRRHGLKAGEWFDIDFAAAYRQAKGEVLGNDRSQLDKVLTVVLIVAILLSIATLAYVVAVPKNGEKFTEFYILGPDGKADNYPTTYTLGDTKPVIVGIADHEYRSVTYDLVIAQNASGAVVNLYNTTLTLADNQTWEQPIDVKPALAGSNSELEFLLYADGNRTSPYRECHLWVNVTAAQ